MGFTLLELLFLATMGPNFGATSVVQSQPLLWMSASLVRTAAPAAVLWLTAAPGPSTTLGGPVGVLPPPPRP